MKNTFYNCRLLSTVPELNVSAVTNFTNTFGNCSALTTCHLNHLKISIQFAQSPNLTEESIMYMINNSQSGTGRVMTLHATAKARLSSQDIDDASAAGWTFA
jgi:hypothetical protein